MVECQLQSKSDADTVILEEEIEELRAELFRQWEYNHAEHCGNRFGNRYPHPNCKWLMPKILLFGLRAPNEVLQLPPSAQE